MAASGKVFTPMNYLTQADEELIAKHFELENAYVRLAEYAGFSTLDIQWLQSRHHDRGSCTLGLLNDLKLKNYSVEMLIDVIKKCNIAPVITYFDDRYPEIRSSYLRSLRI